MLVDVGGAYRDLLAQAGGTARELWVRPPPSVVLARHSHKLMRIERSFKESIAGFN